MFIMNLTCWWVLGWGEEVKVLWIMNYSLEWSSRGIFDSHRVCGS